MRAIGTATGTYRDLYAELTSVVNDPEHPGMVALVGPYRSRLSGHHR
jgi:hypothetical protein